MQRQQVVPPQEPLITTQRSDVTTGFQARPKRQRRLEDLFGDAPQQEARKVFEIELLKFLAGSGLPFSFVERLSTERAFQAARKMPVLELPTRKKLSGSILQDQASQYQQQYESV
ncbi:hypothetical protein P3T76_014767 [Phytophthora citrophthora]|uniref:Uncharacterized protein n=1 Tax=Phytophthora citrophthora TaxID=4793 RepID=A0AAD9G0M3_9STRA|nr:hypothetical protein P3T76_014767 [Phytophthora citrophthora]